MKIIQNRTVIKIAELAKQGKDLQYIIRVTGVKSVFKIINNLRKAGAIIPYPLTRKNRDWKALAEVINNQPTIQNNDKEETDLLN
jgi:hypothetical protein